MLEQKKRKKGSGLKKSKKGGQSKKGGPKKGVRSLLLHVLSVIYFKRITIALFGTGVVLYVKGINSKLNCKGCIDICKL